MNRLKRSILESAVGSATVPEPGVIMRRYCFQPTFIGFAGHFPGYPILPALVQLMTALTCAEELAGRSLEMDTVERAKFLMEILPGHEILVHCRKRTIHDRQGVEVRITVDDVLASSISMTFKGEGWGV